MILEGKTAIVTGAADGMGRAIVDRFSAEGAFVVATDINAEKLQAAHSANEQVVTLVTDITAADAPDRLVEAALENTRQLDILVNAAGIFKLLNLDACPQDEWDRMMDINLNAPFRLCVKAIPALKSSGAGRIVNIASTSSFRARFGMGPYTVSKHGLTGLTISLAVELGEFGITVNSINPGTILTGITRPLMENADWKRDLESQGVLNRIGTVEEIAQAALYLVGPNAAYTTGISLPVDGGFLMKYPERLV